MIAYNTNNVNVSALLYMTRWSGAWQCTVVQKNHNNVLNIC